MPLYDRTGQCEHFLFNLMQWLMVNFCYFFRERNSCTTAPDSMSTSYAKKHLVLFLKARYSCTPAPDNFPNCQPPSPQRHTYAHTH